MRTHAPDVFTTARAQRWEPVETLRALLDEELAGRQVSSIRTRRKAAGFPTGNVRHLEPTGVIGPALGGAVAILATVTESDAMISAIGGLRHRRNLIVVGAGAEAIEVPPFH